MDQSDQDLLQPRVTTSNCLFCPTNSPKPKDSQFTIREKEQHQIIILEATIRECLTFIPEKLFKTINKIVADQLTLLLHCHFSSTNTSFPKLKVTCLNCLFIHHTVLYSVYNDIKHLRSLFMTNQLTNQLINTQHCNH